MVVVVSAEFGFGFGIASGSESGSGSGRVVALFLSLSGSFMFYIRPPSWWGERKRSLQSFQLAHCGRLLFCHCRLIPIAKLIPISSHTPIPFLWPSLCRHLLIRYTSNSSEAGVLQQAPESLKSEWRLFTTIVEQC